MFYDISYPLHSQIYTYGDDPKFLKESLYSVENGDAFSLSSFSFGSHTGTHLDTPRHFFSKGKSITDYPIDSFCGTAQVLSIPNKSLIEVDDLKKYSIAKNSMVLFQTDNSHFDGIHSLSKYTGISKEVADYLVSLEIRLIGIDYLSVEPQNSSDFAVHHTLLSKDILILENLRLKGVLEGEYELFCFPLPIVDADACPVRAVLKQK